MTLNVGVIGVGMIGQDHIRRITHVVSGARISAVTDVDFDRAKSVAADLPSAKALQTGQEHQVATSGSGATRPAVTSIAGHECLPGRASHGELINRVDGRPCNTDQTAGVF